MKKYHSKGTCSQCLFGPYYKNGKNWCTEHNREIKNPNIEHCNQFWRGDFAKRK